MVAMDLPRSCIINVRLKGDSQFHKVDDLTVPDDDATQEIYSGNVMREARRIAAWVGQQ